MKRWLTARLMSGKSLDGFRIARRAGICQRDQNNFLRRPRQYAKEMLSERKNMIAGTLLDAHQPARLIISGSEIYRWIEEGESYGPS